MFKNVVNMAGNVIISRAELEELRKQEYDRGFAEATAKLSKAKTEVKSEKTTEEAPKDVKKETKKEEKTAKVNVKTDTETVKMRNQVEDK